MFYSFSVLQNLALELLAQLKYEKNVSWQMLFTTCKGIKSEPYPIGKSNFGLEVGEW